MPGANSIGEYGHYFIESPYSVVRGLGTGWQVGLSGAVITDRFRQRFVLLKSSSISGIGIAVNWIQLSMTDRALHENSIQMLSFSSNFSKLFKSYLKSWKVKTGSEVPCFSVIALE